MTIFYVAWWSLVAVVAIPVILVALIAWLIALILWVPIKAVLG